MASIEEFIGSVISLADDARQEYECGEYSEARASLEMAAKDAQIARDKILEAHRAEVMCQDDEAIRAMGLNP